MDVPDIVVEWTLGVVSTLGLSGFVFLKSKASKNAEDISALRTHIHTECSLMDQKILDAIEKLGENVPPMSHCNAKQELWQLRFDSWMEQHKGQHEHIKEGLEAALGEINKKLDVVFVKMDDFQECLNNIQAKKECK
jgi:hypothetical protein